MNRKTVTTPALAAARRDRQQALEELMRTRQDISAARKMAGVPGKADRPTAARKVKDPAELGGDQPGRKLARAKGGGKNARGGEG